jgi:hypothetical protein
VSRREKKSEKAESRKCRNGGLEVGAGLLPAGGYHEHEEREAEAAEMLKWANGKMRNGKFSIYT